MTIGRVAEDDNANRDLSRPPRSDQVTRDMQSMQGATSIDPSVEPATQKKKWPGYPTGWPVSSFRSNRSARTQTHTIFLWCSYANRRRDQDIGHRTKSLATATSVNTCGAGRANRQPRR